MSPAKEFLMRRLSSALVSLFCAGLLSPACPAGQTFRAGAAAVEIAPEHFPVLINGGFRAARATRLNDPINARALVLDDGTTEVAIVCLDLCGITPEVTAAASRRIEERAGIPAGQVMITCTHTHTGPAVMAIKSGSPYRHTFVGELNGKSTVSYIPTASEFDKGGYEDVSSNVVPGSGERLVEVALDLLGAGVAAGA
jgi:hypothetical protein